MPLNPNAPHGEVCGNPRPFGAAYEQNGLYFKADGTFAGPPDKEDVFWDPTPKSEDVEKLNAQVAFLTKIIEADRDSLTAMAKDMGISIFGTMKDDTVRKKVYAAWKEKG